jgi:hypothetical protein
VKEDWMMDLKGIGRGVLKNHQTRHRLDKARQYGEKREKRMIMRKGDRMGGPEVKLVWDKVSR